MRYGTKQELSNEQVMELFRPVEGQIALYYGRIRNGKTYAATADILELLARGETVFANWNIQVNDFDERSSFRALFAKFLGARDTFFVYKSSNFHYFHPDDIDISMLGRLVNAHVFIDEGQWVFNSHTKDHDPEKRKLIFHNGHYCRSLNIITQRPINVFKDMRSQVHVWYKCEKKLSFPFLMFQRSRIEDMKDDLPDEEQILETKVYFASKRVLNSYNTHSMRADDALMQIPQFEAYRLNSVQILLSMVDLLTPRYFKTLASRFSATRERKASGIQKLRL